MILWDPYARMHPEGARVDDIKHLCPECGGLNPRSYCSTCHGAGTVDERALAEYEAVWNERINLGNV